MSQDRVQITEEKLLSDNWYVLKRYTFSYLGKNGQWTTQQRETYDRGNGATILLYNPHTDSVILTRQFRLPTFVNGNPSGMLIETCAGLLDNDHPDDAIRRETEEETGYRLASVQKVMEAYMSPGSVTEKLFFYLAEYTANTERTSGGGIDEEEIDVLELPFGEAITMVERGEIMDGENNHVAPTPASETTYPFTKDVKSLLILVAGPYKEIILLPRMARKPKPLPCMPWQGF